MRPNVSKFKIYEESTKQNKYWANYADENILLATHPKTKSWVDLTDPVMKYVSTASPSLADKRTPLTDFLKGTKRTKQVDAEFVKWKLRGTGEVQAVQMENMMPGVEFPGAHGSDVIIKLDVEWYVEGDIIAPDIAKECQVVIQALPSADGSGFVYTTQVIDREGDSYFPPELLEEDIKWIKIGSAYGEASSGYGSTQFSGMSYIEFQSEMTDYGKSVEVTNKAHQLNLRVQMCDDSGNAAGDEYPDQIISYIEAEFLAQAKWEKELMMYYGRSSNKSILDGTSGKYRRIGPGLLEFLEDGNVIPYPVNGGSIDMFVDFLQAIWFDRVSPEKRNITVYTGQGGLKLWNDWITEKYSESATQTYFSDVTKPGKSYDPKNYEGVKYQSKYFTEYNIFPFGSIRVEHWPILDSTWLNGSVVHPETGLPLSSYEFIVLDYGMGNGGGENIELLERTDSEVFTYNCGTWSPAGPINGRTGRSNFSSMGTHRSYELLHACTFGLRMKDVTLSAHFVPSVTI
jgi:hypothetical protein